MHWMSDSMQLRVACAMFIVRGVQEGLPNLTKDVM